MSGPTEFPIMSTWEERRRNPNLRRSIPWSLLAPHEEQAQRNHSQSLRRLAERGGLSPCEAIAVLEDRRWSAMPGDAAWTRLEELAKPTGGTP